MTETPDRSWPDLAGRLDGARHVLPVRVYFEDTDFSGLVYHASYLRWCERGRSDFLRLLGVHHHALAAPEDGGEAAAFVVRRMEIDFLRPARMDEVLEVVSACAGLGGATVGLDQHIKRDGSVLFRARVKVVLIGRSGKPLRLPAAIRGAFARHGGAAG